MALALTAAAGWLGYDRLVAHGDGRQLAWRDLTARAEGARFARPLTRVIESRGELAEVLPGAPPLDFRHERAVLVALGPRSSSGYRVEVTGVEEQRRRVVVTVRERSPELGEVVRPRVTYPFRLIALRGGGKPVEVSG